MLDADTFDALEFVARELRGNPAPFGGIRLVLSGDFFQVHDEKPRKLCLHSTAGGLCC